MLEYAKLNEIRRQYPEDSAVLYLLGELQRLEAERVRWLRVARWAILCICGFANRWLCLKGTPVVRQRWFKSVAEDALDYIEGTKLAHAAVMGDDRGLDEVLKDVRHNLDLVKAAMVQKGEVL